MKKRLFSFILAALMVCSLVPFGVFAEETGADVDLDNLLRTKFTVSSVLAGNDDETVKITISVDKNGGFAGMNYQLLFDGDALELAGEPAPGVLEGLDAVYSSPSAKGTVVSMLTSVNGENVYGDGVLATYTFAIKPGAKAGIYDITLITDGKVNLPDGGSIALEVLDENFDAVPHLVANGSVKIPGYTVTYDANGGSGAPSSQTKSKDDFVYISSVCPSMEGYSFLGWSTDKNATTAEYKAGDKYSTNADLTLYAVWKKLEVIGGSIDIIVSTAEAKTGDEVEVSVSVDNHFGFNGLSFDVIYDDAKLDYVSYTQKMIINGMLEASSPDRYENKVNFQILAGTKNIVDEGELVTLKFKVLEEAEDGFSEISVVPADAFCLNGLNMEVATLTTNVENGGVQISSQIPGDINLDEAVNSDDAVLLLKHISEGAGIDYKGSVDFNGDGVEDEDDAVALLRFVLFPYAFDIEEASLAADADAVYTVENKLGYTGEEVEVAITLDAVNAFKAAGIANISYNKNVFTLNSFEIADEFGNLMYVKDASEMTFVAAAEEEIASYNGKVLTLNFTINEDAAPGNYTITGTPAVANDVNMNTTIYAGVVTVKDISEKPIIPVEKVVLEKTSLELAKGTSAKLNATVTPDEATNKTLTWTSSNENVATVDNKGVVTAIANGTAKITATSDNGKQATCTVNVIIPADAVEVTPGATSVAPGKTLSLKAKAICEDGSKPYKTDVTYEIIDGEELATIDAKGKFVAGEEEGDVTVRVKALYGTEDAYEDIVIKICLNLATKVTLNKTKAGIALGYGDLELSATMACKTGECTDTLTWSVDKPEIATVDENGVVTAHSVGKAKVTAMSGSGKKATCTVTVGEVPATKVDLSGLKATSVVPGKNITLKAKAGRDDKTKPVSTAVDFKIIEGEELATIDAKGKLVAGSEEGTVIVRAKVEAGTAYEDIIVRICTGLATKVTLNKTKAAMVLGYGDLQLSATMVSKEEICEDTLRWIVDKPEIATVDENGVVTAHTSGKVKVTAMAGSGKSASCTVTIGEVPATKVDLSGLKVTSVAPGKNITLKAKAGRDDKEKPVSTVVDFQIIEGEELATIDAKGKLVAGNEEGTVIVRAKVEAGDAYEDIVINICNPATKVTLNMTKATVTVGDELQLEATMTAKGECTDSLKWISADEEIATVDENGLVTVHSAGKVKITAMAGSGKSAYCTVTVTE